MTQQSDTRAKIRTLIAQQLGVDSETIQDTVLLAEQGADEFDMIEITMKLEDQFALIIEDDDIEKLSTIENAVSYIAARKAQKSDCGLT